MLRFVSILFITSLALSQCMYVEKIGSRYPPTKGEIWPKPIQEIKLDSYYKFDPSQFQFKVTNKSCSILHSAFHRYVFLLKQLDTNIVRYRNLYRERTRIRYEACKEDKGFIKVLNVDLKNACEDYPYFGMDESYNLTIAENSVLESDSLWGILRGLESFSQLFYLTDDFSEIRLNFTAIEDQPAYIHRGLLIDTSRHFISLPNILITLDAMTANKMNVLHWHIVDDQSFPYESEVLPEISARAAFNRLMKYTAHDIETVVQYARQRGIRVLPEIDVPGHTRSWGAAYPSVLTECYQNGKMIGLGPMNPLKNETYKLLKQLYKEVQSRFPDKYFHIGGDEVALDCWESNPDLMQYMKDNNLTANELHGMFMSRVLPMLRVDTSAIVWQEVFDENVNLPKNTLVQVWKNYWISEMIKILQAGHKLLFSSGWYLDYLNNRFDTLYEYDPRHLVGMGELNQNIVGGEACMWGEMVDDRNIISRVWPRASAVAEVLWTSPPRSLTTGDKLTFQDKQRIEEHTCRMIRRGIDADPPNGPGFCIV